MLCVDIAMLEPLSMRGEANELPDDPRTWSREQVSLWLRKATAQYQLGECHPERFCMNGKGLLLLTREMFFYRLPKCGGILYEDLQMKLQKAISEQVEQLQ